MNWQPALWSFLVAVAYWPGIGLYATVPRQGIVLLGLALFWPKLERVDRTAMVLALFGLALAATTLLWSPDKMTGLGDLLSLAALVGVFLLAASWDEEETENALLGFSAGLLLSVALIPFQLRGISPVLQESSPAGLFGNREWFGEVLGPILVWLLLSKRFLFAVPLTLALAATGSRVGILAVVVGLGWWWAEGQARRMACFVFCLLASGLALASFGMFTAVGRLNGWLAGISLLSWQGLGLGFLSGAWPGQVLVHSDVLHFGIEFGLLSAPLLALPVWLFWRSSDESNCLWQPVGCAFVAVCFEAVISFPLHQPAGTFLAAVLAGSLASRRDLVPRRLFGSGISDEESCVEWGPSDGIRAG